MAIVSSANQSNIMTLYNITQSSGYVSVPVSGNNLVYSQLDYVKGVNSLTDSSIPISKVRILNNLLNNLHRNSGRGKVDENGIEQQIRIAAEEMSKKMQQEKRFFHGYGKGDLFNILA